MPQPNVLFPPARPIWRSAKRSSSGLSCRHYRVDGRPGIIAMAHPLSQPCRRWLAALLSALIACGPLLTPAYAAGLIPLANEPIGIQNNAPPNIVLTVDDSSSMLSDWLPEAVARDDYTVNPDCRDGIGSMTSICGSPGGASDFA